MSTFDTAAACFVMIIVKYFFPHTFIDNNHADESGSSMQGQIYRYAYKWHAHACTHILMHKHRHICTWTCLKVPVC